MPNGISCAYFAGKNLIYGQKEKNVFKEGIAGIQTTRTIDSAAQSGVLKIPYAKPLSEITRVLKKLLYPLIILSGVYNTIKSDDKVKTGVQQAGGISSMYVFEKLAEKGLNIIDNKLRSTNIIKNNKKLSVGLYIVKGLTFIAASLSGYNLGSKVSGIAVDKIRNNDNSQTIDLPEIEKFSQSNNETDIIDSSNNTKIDEKTFEDFI